MTTVTLTRENAAVLASLEKKALVWMAERMPRRVTSDHLTILAVAAMGMTGAGFALSGWDRRALWLVFPSLLLNWFGDSLDGTLARVRKAERPRYGFYVDHVLDLAGATLLLGGLALSPFMSPIVALLVLVGYLLAAGEVFLATAVQGVFRMSFAGFGPTELRLLLAIGAMALFGDPRVDLGSVGTFRLFDVGGLVAAIGLALATTLSAVRNTMTLARAEPPRQ